MQPWKKLKSETEKVGFRTIVHKTFEQPDGKAQVYDTIGVENQKNVAVVAITTSGKVLVSEQFRAGPERICMELPGGVVDRHEDLEQAARRELKEETGYETSEPLVPLGQTYRDAYMNEESVYFFAKNCHKTGQQTLDDTEHITVREVTVEDLLQNAKNGLMTDGVAVLFAYDELMKIKGGN